MEGSDADLKMPSVFLDVELRRLRRTSDLSPLQPRVVAY